MYAYPFANIRVVPLGVDSFDVNEWVRPSFKLLGYLDSPSGFSVLSEKALFPGKMENEGWWSGKDEKLSKPEVMFVQNKVTRLVD